MSDDVEKAVRYVILHAPSISEIEEKVRIWVKGGWELQGGVAVINYPASMQIKFFQAMIRTGHSSS